MCPDRSVALARPIETSPVVNVFGRDREQMTVSQALLHYLTDTRVCYQ